MRHTLPIFRVHGIRGNVPSDRCSLRLRKADRDVAEWQSQAFNDEGARSGKLELGEKARGYAHRRKELSDSINHLKRRARGYYHRFMACWVRTCLAGNPRHVAR